MRRITHAWSVLGPEQRLAALAALAMLVTMFFPWYGLQNLNRKSGAIYSHNISAFGDVSFVEAAIFLVAAGVIVLLLARAEERDFHLPGGDGTIVMLAGGWAALLIFYRVFSRPAGHGYPVSIEWGFFLAFVAAGCLTYAGRRMRLQERPDPPVLRSRRASPGGPPPAGDYAAGEAAGDQDDPTAARAGSRAPAPSRAEEPTEHVHRDQQAGQREHAAPVAARARLIGAGTRPSPAREPEAPPARQGSRESASPRPRFPPAPSEQLSFEDPPPERD
jgi:hypothetical protein